MFNVIESGLIVIGMPYRNVLRSFKRESAARAYAAKRQAMRDTYLPAGQASQALRAAYLVTVEAV